MNERVSVSCQQPNRLPVHINRCFIAYITEHLLFSAHGLLFLSSGWINGSACSFSWMYRFNLMNEREKVDQAYRNTGLDAVRLEEASLDWLHNWTVSSKMRRMKSSHENQRERWLTLAVFSIVAISQHAIDIATTRFASAVNFYPCWITASRLLVQREKSCE